MKNNLKNKQPGENLRKPQWDLNVLQQFTKDFYVPHSNVANRFGLNLLFALQVCTVDHVIKRQKHFQMLL